MRCFMEYILPSSFGVIILYLLVKFFIKFNNAMTKEDKKENHVIKGNNFTMRDETFEEKNDPIKNLVKEADKINQTSSKK